MSEIKAIATSIYAWERSDGAGWCAHITDNPHMWATGKTEAEAIGKLHISYPDLRLSLRRHTEE